MTGLMPWRSDRRLTTLHDEMDALINRLFGDEETAWWPPVSMHGTPPVETFVKKGKFVVRVDLPGVDPKEVHLAVEGDRLTIKGERKTVEGDDGGEGYREVRYGRFERSISLPPGVDAESVSASYHDGVLEVTMARPKGFAARKVPISVH